MGEEGGSFLTDLDHLVVPLRSGERHHDERLVQVRRDHRRLMDVVISFGDKVGIMIDSQRADFMSAYEHHMIDVQRELQSLREKVATIESDATLKAKLDSLDANQKRYKEKALHLDNETLDLRKKMRKMVGILHTVEKERDWYLQKLRQEKKRFNYLLSERAKLGADGLETSSIYSGSNDSQYSIHIQRSSGTNLSDLKARIKGVYGVSRDQAMLQTLPHILPSSNDTSQYYNGVTTIQEQQINSPSRNQNAAQSKNTKSRTAAERKALGELVALKARQEAMRDFVSLCAASCDKGPWSRIPRRPIGELVAVCDDVANNPDSDAAEEERLLLAFELAAVPETYYVISDLLAAVGDGDLPNNTRGLQWPPLQDGENAFRPENSNADEFIDGFFASDTDPIEIEQFFGEEIQLKESQANDERRSEINEICVDSELLQYFIDAKKQRDLMQASVESEEFMRFD